MGVEERHRTRSGPTLPYLWPMRRWAWYEMVVEGWRPYGMVKVSTLLTRLKV